MTVEEILNGESREVEYKEMIPANSKKYTKTAVAYANCAGGLLIFGVENNTWKVTGIPQEKVYEVADDFIVKELEFQGSNRSHDQIVAVGESVTEEEIDALCDNMYQYALSKCRNRLILRPFREDDVTDVFECWESDPDVAKYMFWTSHNDIEKTREWILFEIGQIEKKDWYRFAIVLKGTNTLIGTALVYYEEEVGCWEIGYNLGKKYWGKGYTTEAMKRVIGFATEELKLTQIVGRYAKENPASGNVMSKLGFKYEKDIPYECNNGAVKREGIQCRLFIDNETNF